MAETELWKVGENSCGDLGGTGSRSDVLMVGKDEEEEEEAAEEAEGREEDSEAALACRLRGVMGAATGLNRRAVGEAEAMGEGGTLGEADDDAACGDDGTDEDMGEEDARTNRGDGMMTLLLLLPPPMPARPSLPCCGDDRPL